MDQKTGGATVSVILLTYNHEAFIKQAFDSILSQRTDFQFEIVVANDASIDQTEAIIDTYRNSHPNHIKGYTNRNNLGGAANFAKALQSCTGKYIAICEGDDYWCDVRKLQTQIDFLEKHPEFSVAFHDAKVIDTNGNVTAESKLGKHRQVNLTAEELKRGAFMPTASVVFRNVFELPAVFATVFNSDTFLWSVLGQHGGAAYLGELKPSAYRVHHSGIYSSADTWKRTRGRIDTYRKLSDHFKNDQEIALHYVKLMRDQKRILIKLSLRQLSLSKFITAIKE